MKQREATQPQGNRRRFPALPRCASDVAVRRTQVGADAGKVRPVKFLAVVSPCVTTKETIVGPCVQGFGTMLANQHQDPGSRSCAKVSRTMENSTAADTVGTDPHVHLEVSQIHASVE